jgi:hypothetical protein
MVGTIQTEHPQGKQGVNISQAKYDVIRDAILETLDTHGEMTFKALSQTVNEKLQGKFDGSISWYVTTVKLDLEARQIIKRVSTTGPQRLQLVAK